MNTTWQSFWAWIQETWKANPAVFAATISAIVSIVFRDIIIVYILGSVVGLVRWVGELLLRACAGLALVDRFVFLGRYCTELDERVSVIKNNWLPATKKLTDIFVPISAIVDGISTERTELRGLFLTNRTIVLVGDPGSGKSTGLKAIALDCLRGRVQAPGGRAFVPVFVELRLIKPNQTLNDYIIELFESMRFPNAKLSLIRLEKQNRLVYLLDGLDEVDEVKRSNLFEEIRAILDRQVRHKPGCHMIVTSRPVGYDGQLAGHVAKTANMADFTPADIRRFLVQLTYDEKENKSADDLALQITTRPPILKICSNPLMLTIVAWLYSRPDFVIPDSREEFYAKCVDALLRAWDKTKNLEVNRIAPELKEAFLRGFAYESLVARTLDFTDGFLLQEIEKFLSASSKYKDLDPITFKSELYRSGIVGRLANLDAFFAHKTLAEFLAARYLGRKFNLIAERWREAPAEWLEVCSLYVADPRTEASLVRQLVAIANQEANWNGMLILVGEAANSPIEERAQLLAKLKGDSSLWYNLEQRALNAIARCGADAQPLLEQMITTGNRDLVARLMHTLSVVPSAWASHHLIEALVAGDVDSAAVESLTLMGENGVPIVERVLSFELMTDQLRLYTACGKILENIGSLTSMQLLAATILRLRPFGQNVSVTTAESLTFDYDPAYIALGCALGRMLDQPLRRNSFESSAPPNSVSPALLQIATQRQKPLLIWALPWMPSNMVYQKAVYATLIALYEQGLSIDARNFVPKLEPIWIRLIVPAFITNAAQVSESYIRKVGNTGQVVKIAKLYDTFPRTSVLSDILTSKGEKLRRDWSHVRLILDPDYVLKGKVLPHLLYALCTIVSMTPMAIAININRLSTNFGWLLAIIFFVGACFSIGYRKNILFVITTMFTTMFPRIVAEGSDDFGEMKLMTDRIISPRGTIYYGEGFSLLVMMMFFVVGTVFTALSVYSIICIRGWSLLCLLPTVLTFFIDLDDVKGDGLRIFRRNNSLLILLLRYELT